MTTEARRILDLAVERFEAAQLELHDAAYAYVLDEACRLSRRFPKREVSAVGGNGCLSIEISRRQPLYWGSFRHRDSFIFDGRDAWQPVSERRLAQPEALLVIDKIEEATRLNSLGACGHVKFKNGAQVLA